VSARNEPVAHSAGSIDRRRAAGVGARRVLAYARLEVVRGARSGPYLLLAIATPFALLLASLVAGPAAAGSAGSEPVRGALAVDQLATLAALGAGLAASGSRLAADRAGGWVQTLAMASLPRLQMLEGRLLAACLLAGMAIVVVVASGAVAAPRDASLLGWLLLAGAIWIGSVPFACLGLAVGLWLGRRGSIAAVVAIYLGLALGGGLLSPIGIWPGTVGTIGRILPTFAVEDLGWHALLGQGLSAHDLTLLAAETLALGSLLAWSRRRA
jgi:ABC-2 type transport system permease protein